MGAKRTDHRFRYWPDLQFHYGFSFDQLLTLPHGMRRLYEEALPRLLAEREAAMIDAASYPHMKPADQRRAHRRVMRALGADEVAEQTATPTTESELRSSTAASGIGFKMVDAEGQEVTH